MAIDTAHHLLKHAVPLIEQRRRQLLLMAADAGRGDVLRQKLVVSSIHVGLMAGLTGHAALQVRRSSEMKRRLTGGVAAKAHVQSLRGGICVSESHGRANRPRILTVTFAWPVA